MSKHEMLWETYPVELLGLIESSRQSEARNDLKWSIILASVNPYNTKLDEFIDKLQSQIESKFITKEAGPDLNSIMKLKGILDGIK